eukprot:11118842-Heterocapsa_arctica.AAC.1
MGKSKELEGIMDLVIYLETKILYKDREEIREEEEKEESPMTNTDFNNAIGRIHTKLDKLIEVTQSKMEENIENTKRTREICAELLREANAVAEDSKAMDAEKDKKGQQDKENKIMAEQQALE